jgi:hypothetical protein
MTKLFPMFIRDDSCFQGKNPSGNTANEVLMTCYTQQHSMMKLATAQFHYKFGFFIA